MIAVELKTPATNINPVVNLLHNRWALNNDFVFVVVAGDYRQRIVVPAKGADFKKLRPRRIRGELVHQALKFARKSGARISWKQADDAYLQVLKQDGCSLDYRLFLRVKLTIQGTLGRLCGYWLPPKNRKETGNG